MPRTLKPQSIDDATWFYDDRKGLLVVHECRSENGAWIRTDQFVIPWKMVRAALKRREK